MSKETLFDIVAEFRHDLEKLEELNLDPNVVRDTIEAMSGKLEDKLRAVVGLALQLQADADVRKQQADRMAKGAKAMANKAEWLLTYAQIALQSSKLPLPLRLPEFTLNLAKLPPAVEADDVTKLPPDFVRTSISFELRPGVVSQQVLHGEESGEDILVFRVPRSLVAIDSTPRKADILAALKEGKAVQGAKLSPPANRLTVR